jgi:hypothetical protein
VDRPQLDAVDLTGDSGVARIGIAFAFLADAIEQRRNGAGACLLPVPELCAELLDVRDCLMGAFVRANADQIAGLVDDLR